MAAPFKGERVKKWLRLLKVKGEKMAAPFKGEGEKMANALLKGKRGKGEKGKRWLTPLKGV